MSIYTNTGLVKHAEKALALKTKYMWGGILRPIEQLYGMLYDTYGIDSAKGYTASRWNELAKLRNKGVYGVDCIGLIKSYYWSGNPSGGTGSPNYPTPKNGLGKYYPDVNAGFMYQQAKVKGKIADMPDIPGLIVYSKSHPHVGVYIGSGCTIESTLGSRGDGVTKRKIDGFWEYWFECPFIEYPTLSGKLPTGCKSASTVDEVAREVIAGKWGSGAERKKRLTAAGYDASAVQSRVNAILQGTA